MIAPETQSILFLGIDFHQKEFFDHEPERIEWKKGGGERLRSSKCFRLNGFRVDLRQRRPRLEELSQEGRQEAAQHRAERAQRPQDAAVLRKGFEEWLRWVSIKINGM